MKKRPNPVLPGTLRFRNFLITFGMMAIAVAISIWFLLACRVETLYIENNEAVAQPTILDSANVKFGRHLYAVSEAKIERKIMEASPYVKSVTLKRELPSTLRILVEEHDLSYFIAYKERYYLLTSELFVLEETTPERARELGAAPLTLPPLKEREASKEDPDASERLDTSKTLTFSQKSDLAWSQKILGAIQKTSFADQITEADISDPFAIRIHLSDKYIVLLGNEMDFERKLERVENALTYLSENLYALQGILHAQHDAPITFEFTGTIPSE